MTQNVLCKPWVFNLSRVVLEKEDSCNRQMSSTPGGFSSFLYRLIIDWPPPGVGVNALGNPGFVN